MTFYELEKICKRKRRNFFIFLFLVFLIIGFSGILAYLNFDKKRESKITNKKVKKIEVNVTKKTSNLKNKLLPIIVLDENISQKKSTPKKEIKKNNKNKNNLILETKNIPSYSTCINLAKKYLKEKNYKQALKWAKIANLQNKQDPSSWIITAKALYKMGKRENALKLLKIYNSYYNNAEVKRLIKDFDEK